MQRDFAFSYEMPRVENDHLRQRSFSGDSYMTRPSKLVTSSSTSSASNAAAMALTPSRYKTELCRPFQEYGFCKYGDKCQFAHGVNDLRSLPRHPKYKTELCRTFYSTGYCPYGTRCHFIHSKNEMLQNHPHIAATGTNGSFPRPIIQVPPTSPSQDSGISSPDDTVSYLWGSNGKAFDFPLSDPLSEQPLLEDNDHNTFPFTDYIQGGGYSSPIDPLINDIDSLSSSSSISPVKPFKTVPQSNGETLPSMDELATKTSSISLDDGIFTSSSSHTRLPVFDDMLNSHSATFIETAAGSNYQ